MNGKELFDYLRRYSDEELRNMRCYISFVNTKPKEEQLDYVVSDAYCNAFGDFTIECDDADTEN